MNDPNRKVPERFAGGGRESHDAQKAWLDGYDTAIRVAASSRPDGDGSRCDECDGTGEVLDAPGNVLDGHPYFADCPSCGGTGKGRCAPVVAEGDDPQEPAATVKLGQDWVRQATSADAPESPSVIGAPAVAPSAADRLLAIAERIAREAHEGQREELTGDPYIRHVERVVNLVVGDDAKVVAWLHDVVEDNPAWTFDRLEAGGIPSRLIRPVSMLTRRPPYSYDDYIADIAESGDVLAIAVKLADLRDHLRPNCPERLRSRYERAVAKLTGLSPAAVASAAGDAREDEESLGTLRGAAEEIGKLSQRLYSRMNSGDIPWDAGNDITGEFCSELRDIQAEIARAEKELAAARAPRDVALRALVDQHRRSAMALEFGVEKLLTGEHADRARFEARLHRIFADELAAQLAEE